MTAPPEPGRTTSLRVDQALHDDLAVLLTAGGNTSDAVRAAVRHVADAYRTAWDYGDYPEGIAPALRVQYAPYDAPAPDGEDRTTPEPDPPPTAAPGV